jgi:hypothetical protein
MLEMCCCTNGVGSTISGDAFFTNEAVEEGNSEIGK